MTIRDDKLVHEILTNGGLTFDIKTNTKLGVQYGYIVAIEGCEKKVAVSELTLRVISDYIEEHLTILNQNRYFLGAWVHEGYVYLDVSKHSSKLLNAIWLGNFEHQIAIWDVENECEIEL